jgi:hypothetical protein
MDAKSVAGSRVNAAIREEEAHQCAQTRSVVGWVDVSQLSSIFTCLCRRWFRQSKLQDNLLSRKRQNMHSWQSENELDYPDAEEPKDQERAATENEGDKKRGPGVDQASGVGR